MDDSEDNMSADDITKVESPTSYRLKPKKRSLVERELETNLTARVTSPASNGEGTSTSRYGRARRLKTETEHSDSRKIMLDGLKGSGREKSPVKVQSPVYKMHASNSPIRLESPKKAPIEVYLDNQIESIYQENISLSRFGSEETLKPSPGKKVPKIYIRKDLIQNRDPEETVMLIKNMFSPVKTSPKSSSSHLSNILQRSSEVFDINTSRKHPNGHIDNSSVVKTLDFDSKKKKKEYKDRVFSKNDLFELEAKCPYQVGDLAWARMGTYPFWPSIITRDPSTGIFVKKKLFGRIERDIIHVTFFGDNGRRGWIVDNMLKKFVGLAEFESAREKFTPEDKKRDPRLYTAFFISEKKQSLWNMSVEEAETLFKEPKRLRIDILNEMLEQARSRKIAPKIQKSGKITRTDSDVSLSESLYDTLFSEDDVKADDSDRSRNKIRNKSLDVSEVVTACLDNMAAKTGITKIQRQSHMDRWLQKAKSKTPEKTHVKTSISIKDNKISSKQEISKKKKRLSSRNISKPYSLRKSANESQNLLAHQNEHDYSKFVSNDVEANLNSSTMNDRLEVSSANVITKVECENNGEQNHMTYEGDDVIAAGSEDANEIAIENERSSVAESDADNVSLGGSNNVSCSDTQDMDVDTTSDTQDSCFSTEKSTEIGTSDSDSQNQTVSLFTNNNVIEKNDRECFSASSEDSVVSLETPYMKQPKADRKHIHDFDYINDSTDSTHANISNKMDIDIINTNNEQGGGRKESIHSLSLQLGTEFNLGSTTHSNEVENFSSESSTDEGDNQGIVMAGNRNHMTNGDCQFAKDIIEKDTSTNDTFITVDEMDGVLKNIADESFPKENNSMLYRDNNQINFQKDDTCKYSKEEDGSDTEEDTLSTDGSRPDHENTVNSASVIDTVPEIPNKNEDSVSDIIDQSSHEVYENGDDTSGDDSALSNNLEVCTEKSNSLKETQPKGTGQEVPLNCSAFECSTRNEIIRTTINKYDNLNTSFNNSSPTVSSHIKENGFHESDSDKDEDFDVDTASVSSKDSQMSFTRVRPRLQLKRNNEQKQNTIEDPEFIKYLEARRDALMDEHPELGSDEIVAYLHKTWLYEETNKSDLKKSDDINHSNFVKGLDEPVRKKTSNRKLKNNKERKKSTDIIERQKYSERSKSRKDDKLYKTEYNKKELCPINIDVNNKEVEIRQLSSISEQTDSILKGTNIVLNQENYPNDSSILNCIPNKHMIQCMTQHDVTSPPSETEEDEAEEQDHNEEKMWSDITVKEFVIDTTSMDSEASDMPLIYSKLRLRSKAELIGTTNVNENQDCIVADNASVGSEDSNMALSKRRQKMKYDKKIEKSMCDPEFLKYVELRQDALIDENPQLSQEEITSYLYKTWLYEEDAKSELKKTDEIEQATLVKGLNNETVETAPPKRVKKKTKVPREITDYFNVTTKDKPKRKTVKPYYNEDFSDIEDEIESFEIKKDEEIKNVSNDSTKGDAQTDIAEPSNTIIEYVEEAQDIEDNVDEVELYFSELTVPKPNIFKGLVREKVCEICENTGQLVKCKGCNGMFHIDCVKKQTKVIDAPTPSRGRKKKKKVGRRPKGLEDAEGHNDDKLLDLSEEHIDEIEPESRTVDADAIEAQLSAKMKEILDNLEPPESYSYSSDDEVDWNDSVPGKCEIVDVKLKLRTNEVTDFSDFKCNNCQKYDTPICFVCKSAISKKDTKRRQRCQVPHCLKYYHIDCLDHWPQTQFNAGEPSKSNKKVNEYFEALTCPRHVCHTCVSDDPRGCKTRFSGDKLAKCVRCPATYHSFTKCIPAGTQILTGSHIICPRHYEHSPGKVPCHVNTGWCFICALGGSLICCEYCPTSFHAECLNIDPPEGGYMCEDCETGRLPLYGEMVWVKLGHYRWWPGIILHPSEIPLNILAVKHRLGEFVVRFFGQYDHYWVNRGRVFPFQEGDSGRISSQKSKIDAAFTTAMEHAQRACEILKSAEPNQEESLDIASSLLPPHYVKLKVNKPCGSLCGRKLDDPELSLTQCECNPDEEDPCGLYSQCLNRMLLTECGPTCRAGDRCNNRAFEKRLYPKLVPYRTPHRGWGLKTLEDIKAGQFVIEYVGELIDEEEFKRRMRRKHEIRDENFYFLTLDKERMIDAGPKGNLARFMNHCCEPNCETQKWTVLGDVRVGLFAINDIPANTEVTFNYNLECAGIEKKRCLCGAKRCSGYIGAKPKQEESQSKKGKVSAKRTYKKHKAETPPSASKAKPKKPLGRPPKPKELTEIEKDLLIIKNATNGLSSDESSISLSSESDRNPKALKRKRVSFSTEEIILYNGSESPSLKRQKLYEKDVGD